MRVIWNPLPIKAHNRLILEGIWKTSTDICFQPTSVFSDSTSSRSVIFSFRKSLLTVLINTIATNMEAIITFESYKQYMILLNQN